MGSILRKLFVTVAVAGVVALAPGGAWADVFTLDQWNVQLFEDNGVSITVTTTATTVEFKLNQGSGIQAVDLQDLYFGSPKFDSVIASGTTTDGGGTAAYKLQANAGNADGFPGSFWDFRHNGTGPVSDIDVTFTFSSVPANLAATDFVAHVQFGSNVSCSGFVGSTNVAASNSPDSGCTTAVPEPTTLVLVGSLLVGLGVATRRKWMSSRALVAA